MSDFDKKLFDRLNEEDDFPGMDKNWQQMHARLDKFAPTPGNIWSKITPYLLAAAVVSVGLLGWKLSEKQAENTALRAENEVLHEKLAMNTPIPTIAPVSVDTVFQEVVVYRTNNVPSKAGDVPAPLSIGNLAENANVGTSVSNKNASATSQAGLNQGNNDSQSLANTMANTTTPTEASLTMSSQTAPAATINIPNAIVSPTAQPTIVANIDGDKVDINPVIDPTFFNAMILGSSLDLSKDVVIPRNTGENTPANNPVETAKITPDSVSTATNKTSDTLQQVKKIPVSDSIAVAAIKPVHRKWRPTFGVGIGASRGNSLKQDKGLMSITGQNVLVDVGFSRNFHFIANVDWFKQPFELKSRPPKFPLPNDPQHPMDHDLEKIEGTSESRQISLNLKYLVPLRTKIKPTIQMGYAWKTIKPNFVRFEFRDHHGGGPHGGGGNIFTASEKTPRTNISNLLRSAFGVEYQIKNWALTAGVEMGTELNKNHRTSNEILYRAGLIFKL